MQNPNFKGYNVQSAESQRPNLESMARKCLSMLKLKGIRVNEGQNRRKGPKNFET